MQFNFYLMTIWWPSIWENQKIELGLVISCDRFGKFSVSEIFQNFLIAWTEFEPDLEVLSSVFYQTVFIQTVQCTLYVLSRTVLFDFTGRIIFEHYYQATLVHINVITP